MAIGISACDTATATQQFTAPTQQYLLQLQQMPSSGFTVLDEAHAINAATVGSPQITTPVARDAFAVRYFRDAGALDTANGPIDVEATAVRFGSSDDAAKWFQQLTAQTARAVGSVAISTGPLGDAAAATSQTASVGSWTMAVQITVQWRTATMVNQIVVRGRYGGTGIEDALNLARQQQANLSK